METKKTVIPFPESKTKKQKSSEWVLAPDKFLSDKEYDRLIAHVRERHGAALCRGSIHPVRDCVLVILLIKSGIRIGESVSLTWSDLFTTS